MNIINDNGFVKSNFIKVYPNAYRGRNSDKIAENNPVPFDPESRLNTEKNYRNTSAIVGKKTFMIDAGSTTYYNPDETGESVDYYHIYFCLQGYKFEIFCQETDYNELLNTTTPYYAKIKINSSKELFGNHRTEILENIYGTNTDECLDNKINNDYYFCGLQITNSTPWARGVTEEEKLFGYNSNTGYYYIRLVGKDSEADPINVRVMKQKLYYNTDSKDINFTDRNLDLTGAELTWKNSTNSAEAYTTDFGIKNSLIYSKALNNSQTSYVWVTPSTVEIAGGGEYGLNSPTALKVANDYITTTVTTINGLGLSTISSDSTSGLTLTTTKENIKLNGIEVSKDSGETNANFVDLKNYKLTGTNNTVTIDDKLIAPTINSTTKIKAKTIEAITIDTSILEFPIHDHNFSIKRSIVNGEPCIKLRGVTTDEDKPPFELYIGGDTGCDITLRLAGSEVIDIADGTKINFTGDDYIIKKTRYIKATAANNIIDTILDKTNFINDTSVNILDVTLETSTDISSLFNISKTSTFSKFNETGAGNKKIIVRFESTEKIDINFYNLNDNSTLVRNKGYFMFEIYPWKKVGYSSATYYFSIYTLQIRVTKTNTGDYYFTNVTRTIASDNVAIRRLIALGYSDAFASGTPIVTILDEPEIVCANCTSLSSFTIGGSKTTFTHIILENSTAGTTTIVEKVLPESFDKLCIYGYGKIASTTNFVTQPIYSPNSSFDGLRAANTAFSVSSDINITPSQAETYFPFKFEISYSDLNAFKGSIDTGKAGKYQCFTSYSDFDGSTNMILELVYLNQCSGADTNYKTLALHIWEQAGMSLYSSYGTMPRIQITKLLITVK